MTPEQKEKIDSMGYESMLSLWRNAPSGHPIFQGDTGEYFAKIIGEKREKVGQQAHVEASKNIGWKGR